MSKTAIVTGGARGIGRGCALELASRGYDIALVDQLEPEMARTKGEIEAKGRKALTYKADVAEFKRAHEVVEDVARQWGAVDFLLPNAAAALFHAGADWHDPLAFELRVRNCWRLPSRAIHLNLFDDA